MTTQVEEFFCILDFVGRPVFALAILLGERSNKLIL